MRRAAAVLAILTLLWAVDAATGAGVFWVHDLRHHHVPWRVWAAGEWLSGRIPLWAPEVANGYPLMADGQAGVFYPPTMLLFATLPPGLALNAAILLHTWWAGLGAFALCRRLGIREGPALVGAVAYGFSGFLATHTLYLGMHDALAWLPWLVLAVVARRWARAGLAAAAMLVAGHPQAAAIGLLTAAAVGLRTPLALAAAFGLAALAAGPQIAATFELVGLSMREGGVSPDFANVGSLPPQEVLNAVLPTLFGIDRPGDVTQTYYHRGDGYWGAGVNHWEMAFYLGIPVVALGAAGVRRRPAWAVLAALALLLMLGGNTPAWPLFRLLPGFGGFRFPVRFAVVLTLAAAVLAASGADALFAASRARRRRWSLALLFVALLFVAGASLARIGLALGEDALRARLTDRFAARVEPPAAGLPALPLAAARPPEALGPAEVGRKVDRIVASLRSSTSPVSPRVLGPVVLLAALALLIRARDTAGRSLTAAMAAALVYADLWSFGAGYLARVPRTSLDRPPAALAAIVANPDRGRVTVVDRRQDPSLDVDLMSASLGLLYGTRDVIVTSPLLLVRNEALLALVGLDVGDRGPVKVERLARWADLVDLLGVRWLLSVHDLTAAGYERVEVAGDTPVGLFRNPDPLLGAFIVGCARPTDDPLTVVTAIDPRREAVVEASVDSLPPCIPGAAGTARILRDDPDRIDIAVEAERPALLVQNDTWYPGWEAAVDGAPAPILRTDLVFRGVVVPAGAHEVSLRYRPRRVRAALLLAPVGLLGLLAWEFAGRRRRAG